MQSRAVGVLEIHSSQRESGCFHGTLRRRDVVRVRWLAINIGAAGAENRVNRKEGVSRSYIHSYLRRGKEHTKAYVSTANLEQAPPLDCFFACHWIFSFIYVSILSLTSNKGFV